MDGHPLSLRPTPVADGKPKNIAEFIARVNAQPGGFRALDEKKLREEIRAREELKRREENGEIMSTEEDEDVDMSDGQDDDDDANDPDKAREEVLKNIDIAGNTAMLTLDFLSLLISKQNPAQASVTLSQQLREMTGIGTIGADRLDDTNVTPDKVRDQEATAVGWTLMEINKTRDAAEKASTFLQRELTAEGRYWGEVMAVQGSRWSVCRAPRERHTLAVRFGFSEAAPEFRNNGLAPMRRGEDGSVQLDCGRLGGISERLLVTYSKDGQLQGRSYLPAHTNDDAPLEARVLEARNTIFSQELWHELTKEARTLAAYDVRLEASRLTCAIEPNTEIAIQLVPLDPNSHYDEGLKSNDVAETISQTLHILLSYAHRHNELTRTRPMPRHIPRSRGPQTYALLRPIIARMMSIRNTQICAQYVGGLVKTLQRAGWPASFTLRTPGPSIVNTNAASKGPNQVSISQTLIGNMLKPIDLSIQLTLLPNNWFTIRGRTFLFPVTTTFYNILLPPSSPIATVCPPYKDGYPDMNALTDYLRTVTTRVLTDHFLAQLPTSGPEWIKSILGTSIRDLDKEDFELRFDIKDIDGQPTALVISTAPIDGKPRTKKWTWSNDGETAPMQDIVTQIIADQAPALS
ncbi:Fc.00g037880.m01.CDS01 [Cosmosporella sp. VM-42]